MTVSEDVLQEPQIRLSSALKLVSCRSSGCIDLENFHVLRIVPEIMRSRGRVIYEIAFLQYELTFAFVPKFDPAP